MRASKRLERIEDRQEQIYDMLGRIDIALIVREPGTARSSEAYEGLRKAITASVRERRQHLAQLVQLGNAIERGASIETLKERCEEWCLAAGLERRGAADDPAEWFDAVEGEGPDLEVISPAWVDGTTGQLVQQGTARRVNGSGPGNGPSDAHSQGQNEPDEDEQELQEDEEE